MFMCGGGGGGGGAEGIYAYTQSMTAYNQSINQSVNQITHRHKDKCTD